MGCSRLRGVRESLRDDDLMRTRIRIAGVEATIDVELRWRVTRVNDTSPWLVRSLERFLNSTYGIDWRPALSRVGWTNIQTRFRTLTIINGLCMQAKTLRSI